jgi:hypothetical protein
VKAAAVAPTPTASVPTTRSAKRGRRASERTTRWRSAAERGNGDIESSYGKVDAGI